MSEATSPREGSNTSSGSATILVVDDEPGVRRLVVRILERAGMLVLVADSGPQAIEMFAGHSHAIDLLLTDVMMPGMTGPELAQQLAQRRPGLKVLLMSGYTAGTVRAGGNVGQEIRLIRKPFTPEGLLAAVRESLAGESGGEPASAPSP
jgi:two-component system, cell cycle sensor histidine kinase and response regulator CckA